MEIGWVGDIIDRAAAGEGRTLALSGPPGIGKTAVLEAAVRLAGQRGVRTGLATGSELERDYAFGAVRQLLGGLVQRTPQVLWGALFDGAAAPARGVLGVGEAPAGRSALPEDPAAVAHALYWLVANLAERGSVLLVADDVQWFDRPSQRFLVFLARRLPDLPVSLLLATRPAAAEAGGEVVADLLEGRHVSILSPAPLSIGAVGQLIARRWGQVADNKFVTACHEACGGNPFLTDQMLRALHDAAVEPTADAAGTALTVGSVGARRQVLGRVAGIAGPSVLVARAIAVLGADATFGQIALLLDGQDEWGIAATVEALAAAGLVVADQPVRFVHPLVRSAIYLDIAPAVRAWWHLRVARSLASSGVASERIAPHLMQVEPEGNPWVVEVMLEAAATANAHGAPDAAAAFCRRALAEPPPPERRHSVLFRLGATERAAGQGGAVEHLTEAMSAARDDAERVAAAWPLRLALVGAGRGDEAVAMLETLHEQTADDAVRLVIEAAIVHTGISSPLAASRAQPRLLAFSDLAVAGDPSDLPPAVAALAAVAAWYVNHPAERIRPLVGAIFHRHRRDAPTLIPPWGAALAAAAMAVEHGDAAQILDWVVSTATQQGDLPTTGLVLAIRARYRQGMGDLVAAAGDADAAIEVCRLANQRQFLPLPVAIRIGCHLERGELADAEGLIESCGYARHLDDVTVFNSHVAHARGRVALAQGRIAEAVTDLRDAGRRLDLCSIRTPSFLSWRSDLVVALLADGNRADALLMAAELLAAARRFGTDRCVGIALRAMGLAERDQRRGEELLREAVAVLTRSPARVELASCLLDLGTMLKRRGARTEAREPLTRSLDLATACGALAVVDRARTELVASGARPRRTRLAGRDSLTVTEARTIDLAAGGATNKQIAQTMFVTIKTVETHLAHAYQKLGISRRADLAGVLQPQ